MCTCFTYHEICKHDCFDGCAMVGKTTFDDDLLNTQTLMTFLWFPDSLWRVVWPELLHYTLCKWLAVKYSDIHQVRLWSQNLAVKDTIVYLVTRSVKRSVCCYCRNKRHEKKKLRRSTRICKCRNRWRRRGLQSRRLLYKKAFLLLVVGLTFH